MLVKMLDGSIERVTSVTPKTEIRKKVYGKVYRELAYGGESPNMISFGANFQTVEVGNLTHKQVNDLTNKILSEGRLNLPEEFNGDFMLVFDEKDIPDDKVYTLIPYVSNDPFGCCISNCNSSAPTPIQFSAFDDESEYEDDEDDEDWDEV